MGVRGTVHHQGNTHRLEEGLHIQGAQDLHNELHDRDKDLHRSEKNVSSKKKELVVTYMYISIPITGTMPFQTPTQTFHSNIAIFHSTINNWIKRLSMGTMMSRT